LVSVQSYIYTRDCFRECNDTGLLRVCTGFYIYTQRDIAGLWYVYALSWIYEKNYIKKVLLFIIFKKKLQNYILNQLNIKKIKSIKIIRKKNIKKNMTILEGKKEKKQIIKKIEKKTCGES